MFKTYKYILCIIKLDISLKIYVMKWEQFYFNYDKYLPGEKIYSSDSLLTALRRAGENSSKERIAEFCRKEMDACDGNATKKVIAVIDKRLNQ